jgi:hypothetical protein
MIILTGKNKLEIPLVYNFITKEEKRFVNVRLTILLIIVIIAIFTFSYQLGQQWSANRKAEIGQKQLISDVLEPIMYNVPNID